MTSSSTLTIPSQIEIWGDVVPAPEQVRAVELASREQVLVLTGSPGTGKTRTVSALLHLFDKNEMQVICLAPTGKAARRMTEQTGRPASTIHRTLAILKDLENISSDVVVVDESSMIDCELMQRLMSRVDKNMRLVFVGDVEQLEPIGPGRVFADMIYSGRIPTVRLTKIFRQASESRIPYIAQDINEGRNPDWSVKGSDASLVEISENKSIRDEKGRRLDQLTRIQQMVVSMVTEVIPARKGIPTDKIQVLCAQKNREIGVEALNAILQDKLNPVNGRDQVFGGSGYMLRCGDRVMQTKNNYDFGPGPGQGVMNGEVGRVTMLTRDGFNDVDNSVLSSAKNENKKSKSKSEAIQMIVDYGDKQVGYTKLECRDVVLGYACSVHRFQGSESPAIVMPIHSAHSWMLTRKLVYTAATRAESFLLFVGEGSMIGKAARNPKGDECRTSLAERLTGVGKQATNNRLGNGTTSEHSLHTPVLSYASSHDIEINTGSNDVVSAYFAQKERHDAERTSHLPMFDSPTPTNMASTSIRDGHYMIRGVDDIGTSLTLRVSTVIKGAMLNKIIVERLDGRKLPIGVAFMDNTRRYINVWSKHKQDTSLVLAFELLRIDPVKCAREYALSTTRCYVCNRKLKTPDSIGAGVGPECRRRGF